MRISCLIPAYNAGPYIAQAIESALSQERIPDEIVVVDDGSTDETAEIVEGYKSVRLVRQANGGIVSARNRCLAECQGDIVAWLDADDLWMPDHLSRLEPLLADHIFAFGDAKCLYADGLAKEAYSERSNLRQLFAISNDEPTIIAENLYKTILPGLYIHHNAMIFRWKDGIRIGGYDPAQRTSSDRLFTLKLSLLGSAIFDPHVHTHIRIHATNTTGPRNYLSVSELRLRALDRCEELVAPLADPEDSRLIDELRKKEMESIRYLRSLNGLGAYLMGPDPWKSPRGLLRSLRTSVLGRQNG